MGHISTIHSQLLLHRLCHFRETTVEELCFLQWRTVNSLHVAVCFRQVDHTCTLSCRSAIPTGSHLRSSAVRIQVIFVYLLTATESSCWRHYLLNLYYFNIIIINYISLQYISPTIFKWIFSFVRQLWVWIGVSGWNIN